MAETVTKQPLKTEKPTEPTVHSWRPFEKRGI